MLCLLSSHNEAIRTITDNAFHMFAFVCLLIGSNYHFVDILPMIRRIGQAQIGKDFSCTMYSN